MPSDSNFTSLSVLVCCGTIIGLIVVMRGGFALLGRIFNALTGSYKNTSPSQVLSLSKHHGSGEDSQVGTSTSRYDDYDDTGRADNTYDYPDDEDDEDEKEPKPGLLDDLMDSMIFLRPNESKDDDDEEDKYPSRYRDDEDDYR
jgi:hypothetical protein